MKKVLIFIFVIFIGIIFCSCEKDEVIENINGTVSNISKKKVLGKQETKIIYYAQYVSFQIPKGAEIAFISFGYRKSFDFYCTINQYKSGIPNNGAKIFSQKVSSNGNYSLELNRGTNEIILDLTKQNQGDLLYPTGLVITVGY